MLLRVKVKTKALYDQVCFDADGSVLLKIKALPIDGKANKYLVAFIASKLEISKNQVTLIKGLTSTFKTFDINESEEIITKRLLSMKK